MNAAQPQNGPLAVTTDEAKRIFSANLEAWIEQLQKLGIPVSIFAVQSSGKPGDMHVAVDVGLHCALLEERGCEVLSASTQLVRLPKPAAVLGGPIEGVDTTLTTLTVRLPKRAN